MSTLYRGGLPASHRRSKPSAEADPGEGPGEAGTPYF